MKKEKNKTSTTKSVVTAILLVVAFPIGWFVMIFGTKWPVWLKIVMTILGLPLTIMSFAFFAGLLSAVNPRAQIDKAKCVTACVEQLQPGEKDNCFEQCAAPMNN
jgi:hypothetical protein